MVKPSPQSEQWHPESPCRTRLLRGAVCECLSAVQSLCAQFSFPLLVWLSSSLLLLYRSWGSSAGAGCRFNAVALKQDQAGGTVAAGDTGPVTGSHLVPVMACFSAAGSTRVINRTMFAVCAYSRRTRVKYEEHIQL